MSRFRAPGKLAWKAVTAASMAIVALAVAAGVSAGSSACESSSAQPGTALTCAVPGFERRPYTIHLPPDYDPSYPVAVILAIHGGGGNAAGAARTACPDGNTESADCLHAKAGREGIAVVYPNGTSSRLLDRLRTWNAGGGTGDWQCVSGRACKDGVNDVAYFQALLDDLGRWLAVDRRRVFATGLSNGGAMSHRLACEMADRIAAIAPLGGANQFAAASICAPSRPVPVLQIHGTADPCWPYDGGKAACAQRDGKIKVSVEDSMRVWAAINGCDGTRAAQPFASEPGINSVYMHYNGCAAETGLIRMEGGGHVWPGGWAYFGQRTIGPMVEGWSANRLILEFFLRNPMPD